MIDSSKYPVRERIVGPFVVALEQLSHFASSFEIDGEIKAARNALQRLQAITTPAQELIDDFVGGFGPIEGIMSRAANESWRGDGHGTQAHSDELTVRSTKSMREELLCFIVALAESDEAAEELVSKFMGEHADDIKQLFDLAQEDGWKHGDYRTAATDEASARMAEHIRSLAKAAFPTEESKC